MQGQSYPKPMHNSIIEAFEKATAEERDSAFNWIASNYRECLCVTIMEQNPQFNCYRGLVQHIKKAIVEFGKEK